MSDSRSSPYLAYTPLFDRHHALGARMVALAGHDMPAHDSSGIIEEHLHTLRRARPFDVSPMGQLLLEGAEAARQSESLVPCDILGLACPFSEVAAMTFLSLPEFESDGTSFIISQSGYTSKNEFEISAPAESARALVEALQGRS